MSRAKDLTGKKFGKWIVLERSRFKGKNLYWLCKCDCGNRKEVDTSSLKRGKSKSCGCSLAESRGTHGHALNGKISKEYVSWRKMIERCESENNVKFPEYGGRGIKVCERWHEFDNFLSDMGEKPTENHTIDRIDVNGDYEFSNCKWSTYTEQSHNRRVRKTNKTGVSGVWYNKSTNRYIVTIGVKRKNISIGSFKTLNEASNARKKSELKYWGKSSL